MGCKSNSSEPPKSVSANCPASTSQSQAKELSCSGEKVELTGILKVYAQIGMADEIYQYILIDDKGLRHPLQFGSMPPYQSGDQIQITGYNGKCSNSSLQMRSLSLNPPIVVETSTLVLRETPRAVFKSMGPQSTLAIVVNFQDKANSFTQPQAQDVVFSQVNQYWLEASFQKTWVTGKAVGPYTVSLSSNSCDTASIASQAQSLAKNAGVDLSPYNRFVYIFPKSSACGGWIGLGDLGGTMTEAWTNGVLNQQVVSHEMGHNIGLYHAHTLDCGSTVLGSNCTSKEYADPTDTMGNIFGAHYAAYHKEQLGWLNPGKILTVNQSGTYTLESYESQSSSQLPKALKILKSTEGTNSHTYYYVEFRQPVGFDSSLSSVSGSNLASGIIVHTGSDSNRNSSYLLNMNPGGSWYKAALNPGESYHDPQAGFILSLTSAGQSGAQVSVTFDNSTGSPSPAPGKGGNSSGNEPGQCAVAG